MCVCLEGFLLKNLPASKASPIFIVLSTNMTLLDKLKFE